MADHIEIAVVENLADDDLHQVKMLLAQLSTSATFDPGRVQSMVDAPGVDLFVARDGGRIVGMATLVTFPLVTGWRGFVEDVVVSHQARGRGIARLLLSEITAESSRRRLRTLDLTSRPTRESALKLYESVGFRPRDTNVLRYTPPLN
ncbi:ribosomal protein S18 acetylase RimI-like enzyme [Arthrobacter woluwensis]|uniref:GNAT family N-acetyltransferase n=1 Tax=Arthrobacter woluwensis TaxID=156980 RepID=UPI0027838F22|nr:GNAT family N-acetyltransferase [Arthrobacter woluwensis]MDQ0708729.1 ribosomal protein S18 acetylase RimI-like enzyme [Arthrobacter woluwensis]